MRELICISILFLSALIISAQTGLTTDLASPDSVRTEKPKKQKKFKARKHIKAANRMMAKGNIYAASDQYEIILSHTPDDMQTAYKLAESYRIARDYKKAEEWYRTVTEKDPLTFPQAYYWYAMMLKMNAKYEAAKPVFEDFRKSYKGEDAQLKEWAQDEAKGCDLALKLKDDPLPVNVTHLNKNVNSPYSDLAPLMWNDTTLLFASLPSDTVIVIAGERAATDHYIKLYEATVRNRHDYQQSKVFDKFNLPGVHTANGAFSPDKKRFYFTQCTERQKGVIICGIYVSEWKDSLWSDPESLGAEINLPEFTTTHPFITPGKKGSETLYFASNRPEGKGGLDIWYSTYNIKKKTYAAPRNAGTRINTDRDEATPYYDAATGYLYFSSNGQVNIGGYDIFRSAGNESRWDEPANIGYPINSSADDMYFRVADDGKMGYFVSNRPGIISIRSETCCDDIFAFEYIKIINLAAMGVVYDEDDASRTPINNAIVTLSFESGEGILQNISIGDDTIVNGKPYFFPLNLEKEYRVSGTAEGYLTNSVPFNTKSISGSDTLTVDIAVKKLIINKVYRLKNVYYDFDKWDLREVSKLTLDTVYNLMIENPTIIVEIGSHTDSRATEQYNVNLSQKRAESCVNYLIGRGIQKERLHAKGYGESRPLDDCSRYSDCPDDNSSDCPCHQNNRRTEFKVVGELDAELIYEDQRFEEVTDGDEPEEKKKKK